MPPEGHALLSASSAERWIHCPPSARLCERFPDAGSDYSAEGTDAHALCEYRLRKALGLPAEDPTEHLTWFNAEMDGHAGAYAEFVAEKLSEMRKVCPGATAMTEQRVDYSRWVPEGFGTSDAILAGDGVMHVIDFKYGKKPVSAEENPQMKCYALGTLEMLDMIYEIGEIEMTIFQPRIGNISSWRISREALCRWAEEELKPAARLAFAGEGEFHCGEWCGFCRARSQCRARAEANLILAQYEFRQPPLLTDIEIEAILACADRLTAWAEDVKEFARKQAVDGKEWQGWKLVEGKSNRRYTDEAAVGKAVEAAGFDPWERKLRGIPEMEKLLKGRFRELIGAYIEKPKGKPTLVPANDKRPAMSIAQNDFKEEIENDSF